MKSSFNARSTTGEAQGINLTGKTVLLAGRDSGPGFKTLRQMADHGAHVIAAARVLSDPSSVRQAIATVLTSGRQVDSVTGRYFSACKIAESNPPARGDTMGERLWALSEQLVAVH